MNRRLSTVAAATCCITLTLACASRALACQPDPGRQNIRVAVDPDGQPTVNPEDVTACIGEKLTWIFQGPVAREFRVQFTSVADSPFDWSEQKGARVVGTVKDDALKDKKRTQYKYAVDVAGKVKDPKIIIEP